MAVYSANVEVARNYYMNTNAICEAGEKGNTRASYKELQDAYSEFEIIHSQFATTTEGFSENMVFKLFL